MPRIGPSWQPLCCSIAQSERKIRTSLVRESPLGRPQTSSSTFGTISGQSYKNHSPVTWPCRPDQSYRRATIGLTRVADPAGINAATVATRISTSVTNPNVTGSRGPTLYSRLESTRVAPSAATKPTADPDTISLRLLPITSRKISPLFAPNAKEESCRSDLCRFNGSCLRQDHNRKPIFSDSPTFASPGSQRPEWSCEFASAPASARFAGRSGGCWARWSRAFCISSTS